ncbi:MAG: hypothetical protein K2N00_04870 [Lachnospiraceae bacterium]|nr:hypothetical protein [Lachnospiraceae bacterium]
MNPSNDNVQKQHKKRTPKQIAALLCVILLLSMYVVTFIVACLDLGDSGRLFAACLLTTIALPILLWIYIWLYGVFRGKHNMASLDLLHSDEYTGTNLVREEENDTP